MLTWSAMSASCARDAISLPANETAKHELPCCDSVNGRLRPEWNGQHQCACACACERVRVRVCVSKCLSVSAVGAPDPYGSAAHRPLIMSIFTAWQKRKPKRAAHKRGHTRSFQRAAAKAISPLTTCVHATTCMHAWSRGCKKTVAHISDVFDLFGRDVPRRIPFYRGQRFAHLPGISCARMHESRGESDMRLQAPHTAAPFQPCQTCWQTASSQVTRTNMRRPTTMSAVEQMALTGTKYLVGWSCRRDRTYDRRHISLHCVVGQGGGLLRRQAAQSQKQYAHFACATWIVVSHA
eukprot:6177131-Pleurochrysis_carterae.AAC.1